MSRFSPLSLAHVWHRYEGPTWIVALAVYGGWFALILRHASLPWWIVVLAGAWLVAWHGSLQHETIDALEHVPPLLRAALAAPPLGVFFPFGTYRREHRLHHQAGPHVTETAWDPETFYHDRVRWAACPRAIRGLYRVNQTLLGRLTIGPFLQTAGTVYGAAREIAAPDTLQREWAIHVATTGLLFWWLSAVAHMPWWQYVAWIAYPGASLTMLRSFAEHRSVHDVAGRTATVENRFPFGILFLNNNYHAQHHAAPSLPWYRIPAAWRARHAGHIERSGAFHASGYGAVVRRWLLHPAFEPVEDRT